SGISSGITRYGEGTASFFSAFTSVPPEIRYTPIAVIGYGAAGIMATYALRQLNFRKVTVFEQAKPLGIWSHDNVFRLSRNNPLRLQFFDEVLNPAPGGGTEVREFLEELVGETPRNAKVIGVKPGNLKHRVYLAGGEEAEFPIVINAMGLGKPKPVSDPDRMITQTGQRNAGIRWQHRLDPEKVRGKRIILIGLGNSTAEMLQQIHDLIDSGVPIDYQVLTHYPQKSVENPTTDVRQGKRVFHVFRDLSKPNLVDYQGDLPRSRYDYFRALHEGRIISGVTRWEVPSHGMMVIYDKNEDPMGTLPFDQLMTLIGYHRSEELMRSFGCTWDPMTECGVFDYDGEVAARPGSIDATKRLHKGCFGFGSILETPHNPNAIVIPGMLHRVGDLMFAIIMRAGEYNKRALRV
ncbi:NAD(P)-binding protein, partial [Candidatus Kaiserbacteria bacterium]|nr:NAD(P)-binding protein [Candidatus Kaiserbacteria bacterium]